MQTFLITLPIFLIIAAGFLLTRLHIAQNRWVNPLNNFVYYIALPALIILSIMRLDAKLASLGESILLVILITVLSSAFFALILRLLPYPKKTQLTILLTAILGNTIFLGIPIGTALISSVTTDVVTTISVVSFTTALVCALIAIELSLKKSRGGGHMLHNLRTNPIIISLMIGIAVIAIPLPKTALTIIESPLQLIAQTASPLALFALGGFLAHHKTHVTQWPAVAIATVLKLAMLPAIFVITLAVFSLPSDLSILQIIMAATPTAVTAFVLTEKYRLDNELAATVMLTSTVLSVVSLPVLFALIS